MAKTKVDALALSVGKAIAARRQDAGLTQEQVAEQLKIGNEAVSRMERGLVMPTVARLLELATV
jgi:transcriptional regulator with XRE-family HTH domain